VASYDNTVVTTSPANFNEGTNNPLTDPVNDSGVGPTLRDGTYYPTDLNQVFKADARMMKSRIYNAFFNQEIVKNLFFEAAWQREVYDREWAAWMTYNFGTDLKVDPNQYLPDGVTPNPYAGDFYFAGDAKSQKGEWERDEWRLSLAYTFDFSDHFENNWLKRMGRHVLAGLYNDRRSESMDQEYRPRIVPKFRESTGLYYDPYIATYNYPDPDRVLLDEVDPLNVSQGSIRTLNFRAYVNNTGKYTIIEAPYNILSDRPYTFIDDNGEEWVVDPENAAVGTRGERLTTGRNTTGIKDKIITRQVAYTGYFFGDRLVYTFGYREDELNSADEKAPDWTWLNRETGNTESAGFIAHRDLYGYYDFDSDIATSDEGITRYHGFVLHPFRRWSWSLPLGADLSFHYSDSNTFQAATPRVDADGRTIPGEQGDGVDKGFTLSLFRNKFTMRYNEYEINAGPAPSDFNRIRGMIRPTARYMLYGFGAADPNGDGVPANQDYDEFIGLFPDWPLVNRPGADPRRVYPFWAGQNFANGDFGNELDPYTATADRFAQGKEITIGIRPTDNINIRITYSEEEVTETNIAGAWVEFVNEFIDFMDNSPNTRFVEGYNPSDNQKQYNDPNGFDMDGLDLDPDDGLAPGIDYFRWDQIPNGGGENSRALTDPKTPWGQDNGSVDGGWGRETMRERYIREAVFDATGGINIIQAFEGKPNDFVQQKRMNVNASYRFREGFLNGTTVGFGYRWREAPVIGLQAVPFINEDGEQQGFQPDVNQLIEGESEDYFDLTLSHTGKFKWIDKSRYTARLIVRNLFPDDDLLVPRSIDSLSGNVLRAKRVPDRQFVVSFELRM
jgi:hypothetical protein